MLDGNTADKLRKMRLSAMAEAFERQIGNSDFAGLCFEDRFGLLVDCEWTTRRNNLLANLTRRAEFAAPEACVEDIKYRSDRCLDRALITRLESCNYIQDRHNVIIMGASGSGKTWLACALGVTACRQYFPVRYVRLPDMLTELAVARVEGAFRKVIDQYKKVALLIIDEWLLYPVSDVDIQDILEFIDRRHRTASTIICSQYDVPDWHGKLRTPTIADAICDRLAHDSYKIIIEGAESMRKQNAVPKGRS